MQHFRTGRRHFRERGVRQALGGPWTWARAGEMGSGAAFWVSIPVVDEAVSVCAYAYGCTRTYSYKPVYM